MPSVAWFRSSLPQSDTTGTHGTGEVTLCRYHRILPEDHLKTIGKNRLFHFPNAEMAFWESHRSTQWPSRTRAHSQPCARRPRRSMPVHNQMGFRAVSTSIRGIGARFDHPKSARTEQMSIAEVDQSMRSPCPSSSSRTSEISCQTPAACQSRRRRQQVMPNRSRSLAGAVPTACPP